MNKYITLATFSILFANSIIAADTHSPALYLDVNQPVDARVADLISRLTIEEKATLLNHGGPFPATGHPGFTAVGIPASLRRFAMLQCFDNVRPARQPAALRDGNPNGRMWRLIDGNWSQGDVSA